MKIKNRVTFVYILFFINIFLFSNSYSSIISDEINLHLKQMYGNHYEIKYIIEMDSILNKQNPFFISEDPYYTLQNVYIFTAGENKYTSSNVFGIYKSKTNIFITDTLITWYSGLYFLCSKDINNDGIVEVLMRTLLGANGQSEGIWIYSWDGIEANRINALDDLEETVIIGPINSLKFIDLNADGIYELKYSGINDEKYIWSWNGSEFGHWPDTPPIPDEETIYPRNGINVSVDFNIVENNGQLEYLYTLFNHETSHQKIDEFHVQCRTDSLIWGSPEYWKPSAEIVFHLSGWRTPTIENMKGLILPGLSVEGFSFNPYLLTLPSIALYFVQGYNSINLPDFLSFSKEELLDYFQRDMLENAVRGYTIGPADPPDPFIASNFLDTLMTYPDRCFELNWITNRGILNSLNQKLGNARKQLDKGKIKQTVNMLNALVNEVEAQNGNHLTSEAYALLKYNAEYLMTKLEE